MCDCLDVSCVYEYDVCQSPYVLASTSPGVRAQAATPSACGHLVHHEGISYCMSALPYVSSASIHTPDDRVNSLTQAPLGVHRPYPASLPVARKKKHLSSSSLPSLVTRIVTPAPRRSFLSLPFLAPHRHPRGAARVSPSKRTRHLIVQVLVLPLPPEVVSRTIRQSSSGSALPGVNPRRKERHEGRRIRA